MPDQEAYDQQSRDTLAIVRLRETIRRLQADRIILLAVTVIQAAVLAAAALYLKTR